VFLASNTVGLVAYCVTKMATTCLSMVGQFFCFDTIMVVTTHQNISAVFIVAMGGRHWDIGVIVSFFN